MPQVPTIDEPSVQETPGQEVPFQAPPQGAFPGAVGASIEAIGSEIGRIAYEEKQKAASDEAIQAETEYQNFVLDTHSKFIQLHGDNALAAYDDAKNGLRDTRLEMAGQLKSRTAQRLFMNSSLRTWRIYESQIDGHTAMERRSGSARKKTEYIAGKSTSLGVLAGSDAGLDVKAVANTIQQVRDTAEGIADEAGVPGEDRQDFIQKILATPIDSYMRVLLKGPNRRMGQQEFEKYKDLMTPAAQATYLTSIKGNQVNDTVAQIMANIPRIDAERHLDSQGFLDVAAFRKKQAEQPHTADGDAIRDKMKVELDRDMAVHRDAGAQLRQIVEQQGQTEKPGVPFVIPEGSPDWADLQRLHPDEARVLRERANNQAWKYEGVARRNNIDASKATRARAISNLFEMNPEEAKLITPQGLRSKMLLDNPSVRDEDVTNAQNFLLRVQSGKLSDIEKRVPEIVRDSLREAYKGSARKVETYEAKAKDMAREMIQLKPDIDTATLHAQLVKEFTKPNFWSDRPGESYVRPPPGVRATGAREIKSYRFNRAGTIRIPVYSDGTEGPQERVP